MKIGQWVVCIDDVFDTSENFNDIFKCLPNQHKAYRIRKHKGSRILLREIINPICFFNMGSGIKILDEPGFNENRFILLDNLLNKDICELLDEINALK